MLEVSTEKALGEKHWLSIRKQFLNYQKHWSLETLLPLPFLAMHTSEQTDCPSSAGLQSCSHMWGGHNGSLCLTAFHPAHLWCGFCDRENKGRQSLIYLEMRKTCFFRGGSDSNYKRFTHQIFFAKPLSLCVTYGGRARWALTAAMLATTLHAK